jgi:uncharacterized protein (DUF2336 family)
VLALKIGLRPDIPARLFGDLVLKATEAVQRRLFASDKPGAQSQMRSVIAKATDETRAADPSRDYSAAQHKIEALRRRNKLDEAALVAFASTGQFEETVAALAALCVVPIGVVDRLMSGSRPDPVLILAKSAGWGWPTVKAVIMARPDDERKSSQGLKAVHAVYERLSPAIARRIVLFWRLQSDDA